MYKKATSRFVMFALSAVLLLCLTGCHIAPTITEWGAASDVANELPSYCAVQIYDVNIDWHEQYASAHGTKYTKFAAYYGTVDLTASYSISRKSDGWVYEGFYEDDDTRAGVVSADLSGYYNYDGYSFELQATDDPNVYTMYADVWYDDTSRVEEYELTFERQNDDGWFWGDSNDFHMVANAYIHDDFSLSLQGDELVMTAPEYGVLASGLSGDLPISWYDDNVEFGELSAN